VANLTEQWSADTSISALSEDIFSHLADSKKRQSKLAKMMVNHQTTFILLNLLLSLQNIFNIA
jgi:hypothetical protein